MRLTILGNNSALPAYGRHPSCQIVSIYGVDVMLDCGEGAQIQMQRYGLKWRNLAYIFISHLHGDHYFGLPGLINSLHLLGRSSPLHIFAPAALEGVIQQILGVANTTLCFPLLFQPLPAGAAELVDTPVFSVSCFPVEHRISCHGFVVTQKSGGRKLLPQACEQYGIPMSWYERLKQGEDYRSEGGVVVKNNMVTADEPPARRYAYCADTLYTESFLPHVHGVDLLYHEATYLHDDAAKAMLRYHSTATQAALFAQAANAGRLLLGHFSSKYKDLSAYLEEAASVFPNVELATEGTSYEI